MRMKLSFFWAIALLLMPSLSIGNEEDPLTIANGSPKPPFDPALKVEMSRKVTDAIQSIKVGTTRATLLKLFEAEGGLFSSTGGRYLYRGCPYIRLDIQFQYEKDKDGRPILGLNDKITKVSKPYLEFVFHGD